jgi:hypothetical protein
MIPSDRLFRNKTFFLYILYLFLYYVYFPNTKTKSLYVLNLLGNKVNSDSEKSKSVGTCTRELDLFQAVYVKYGCIYILMAFWYHKDMCKPSSDTMTAHALNLT